MELLKKFTEAIENSIYYDGKKEAAIQCTILCLKEQKEMLEKLVPIEDKYLAIVKLLVNIENNLKSIADEK